MASPELGRVILLSFRLVYDISYHAHYTSPCLRTHVGLWILYALVVRAEYAKEIVLAERNYRLPNTIALVL